MFVDTSEFERLIKAASKVVLIGHFNPDGDSVGSVVAAAHYFASRGLSPVILLPSAYPDSMEFLNPEEFPIRVVEEDVEGARAAVAAADLVVCLDFNRLSRSEYLEDAILGATGRKVLIDHHLNPERECFDLVFSCIEVSSACELLFWVIMNLPDIGGDVQRLPMKCAEAIYVGMMTDTNNFSNSVVPSTFEMAARLIARGIDKDDLQERILHCYSIPRTRLMGHLVKDNLRIVGDYAAYMTLSNEEKDFYEFKPGDSEGFVNIPLSISSVKVSALFTENFDGKYIRVSLRSKGEVDVNSFAKRYFNGGGHRNASGGRLYMPIGEVPAYFERSLAEWLDEIKFS